MPGRPLTSVVRQPLVPSSLEVLAVELGALLRPEVPGTLWAALQGRDVWGLHRGPPTPLHLGWWDSSPPTTPFTPAARDWEVWAPRPPECSPAGASGCWRGRCHFGWEGEQGASRSPDCAPAGGCPGNWEERRGGAPEAGVPTPAGFTSVWQERWLRAEPTQLEPPSLLKTRTPGRLEPREPTPLPPPRALLQATRGRGGGPAHTDPLRQTR